MWMRRDHGQGNLQEPLSKTMQISNQEMQMVPRMLDVTCQLKGVKQCFHSQARKLETSKGAAHRVRRSRRPFSLSEAEKGMNFLSLHGRHCAVYTRSLCSLNQYFHFYNLLPRNNHKYAQGFRPPHVYTSNRKEQKWRDREIPNAQQ